MNSLVFATSLIALIDLSPSTNERTVEALFDAFNRRDMAAMEALYAPDAVLKSSDFCQPRGRSDLARTYAPLFEGHPDVRDEVRLVVVDGDRAAVQFDAIANAGEQPLRLRLAVFLTFRNGLIVEDDTIFDTGGMECQP